MRFPKYHIATSVVNRILDMADHEMLAAQATEAPSIPNTAEAGARLDNALRTPVPPVPAPAGSDDQAVIEMQQGGTAADAVGGMAVLDAIA